MRGAGLVIAPPPLACGACGQTPASLRLVDLEAEALVTGAPAAQRYAFVPRCQRCRDALRARRDGEARP